MERMNVKRVGTLKLYCHYASVLIRSNMQYKMSFWLGIAGQLLVSLNGILGLYFMFTRFSEVRGYTYRDVLLCYALMLLEFSIAQCLARGFESFSQLVRQGEFDRMLVRPRSPILQVFGSRFEVNRIIRAGIIFVFAFLQSDIMWTGQKIFTVCTMIAGGTLLFISLFILCSALCFFTMEDAGFLNVLTYGGVEHGKYPIDIYGRRMFGVCTFLIPYTLVQYYPLQYLLGRSENAKYALYPFGTLVFFAICYMIWQFGMSRYQSAGS